jgi:4-phospho-D-threonate 3-dehydrogenase / 4-phospho-D-erythronate 3-dehydrogenase
MSKPRIAITMGDPAGVGPEIIAKTLTQPAVFAQCVPLVVGDLGVMRQIIAICGLPLSAVAVDAPPAEARPGTVPVLDLHNIAAGTLVFGRVDAACGRAAGQCIEKAVALALAGEVDAIVTAPINKEALMLGGYAQFRGHTEMLAALTHSRDVTMLLASGKLRVVHVTIHVALRQAIELIDRERVLATIRKAQAACQALGIARPAIGVAGLNPHCGENGMMGREEIEHIVPAIAAAKAEGLDVHGPIPADTIFPRGKAGVYDIIVAMYHDQGHIPVKLLGFNWCDGGWGEMRGVNITIGLPIIRTSVDHGTAFGKAGKGSADATSLLDAIDYAVLLAQHRTKASQHKSLS